MCKQFSENPREANEISKRLITALGGGQSGRDLFAVWYHDEKNGYRAAYQRYYNEEIWNNATSLIDIIKQSPNILPWEFVEKAEELGVKPKLGELPKEFVSEEVFNELLTAIRTHNEEVMRKNPNETIEKALLGQEYTVKTSAGNYKIVTATTGERPKNVLLITPENDGENSFVLKYIPADSGKKINYTLSNNLVPDLPYINAMIDFYLKENKCKNSPDIRYFDFDKQIVIYTNRGGEKTDYNADLGNLFLFSKNKFQI